MCIWSFILTSISGYLSSSMDVWLHFAYSFMHYCEVHNVFMSGNVPYYPSYDYKGGSLVVLDFGNVGTTFSELYRYVVVKISVVFPYLPSPMVSVSDACSFVVYLFQRLVCFACTDDIIVFSGICLILDHMYNVLVFFSEILYGLYNLFWSEIALPIIRRCYSNEEDFILFVTFIGSLEFFYVDLSLTVIIGCFDFLFLLVDFVMEEYLSSFDSVFLSLREFWPNSAGSRTFVLFYGWLIFILLLNKKFRSTAFGKPPTTPIVPGHKMDLYCWRDPLRYNKICNEQSSSNFDVLSRNIQMVKAHDP